MSTPSTPAAQAPPFDVEPALTAYPDHYPLRYTLYNGPLPLCAVRDAADLAEARTRWGRRGADGLLVRAEQVAPDDTAVTTRPVIGGTWGGFCGATAWFIDDGERVRDAVRFLFALSGRMPTDELGITDIGSASAPISWWLLGIKSEGRDGFRVTCAQSPGHDEHCSNGPFTWDPTTGQPTCKDLT